MRGTFEVEDNVAHLTVNYKNGTRVDGNGSVTILEKNGTIIVIIIITVGELEVDEDAIQVPNGFEPTFRRIQGSWIDSNSWLHVTANQASVFDVNNQETRAVFATSFIISESDRLNIEILDEIPFQLLFFDWEDFQLVGRIDGSFFRDNNFFDDLLEITGRVVEQHALSSYIPNIGVYHRGTP